MSKPSTHPRPFHFVSLHPQVIEPYVQTAVFKKASEAGSAAFHTHQLRDFAVDRHGSVDGPPFGGGDGMVMRCEPLVEAIESIPGPRTVICPSPAGRPWKQELVPELLKREGSFIFLCGRFGGIDQRVIDGYVDYELSIGDYVISGGELASLVIADSLVRALPGALGSQDSYANDSFTADNAGRVEFPLYTKPRTFREAEVPAVLLSGDHQKIKDWREEQSLQRTQKNRSSRNSN